MTGHRGTCALVLGCLLVAATASAQDDAFKTGMQARERERWSIVAEAMREAIKEDPKESERRVREGLRGLLGQGGDPYLPHYFLGDALYRQGDCVRAVIAWEESEAQGVATKSRDRQVTISGGYDECEKRGVLRPAVFKTELDTTRAAIASAERAGKEASGANATAKDEFDSAQNSLREASRRFDDAQRTRSPQAFVSARNLAGEAERGFRSAVETASSRREAEGVFNARQTEIQRDFEDVLEQGNGLDAQLSGAARIQMPADADANRRAGFTALSSARKSLDQAGQSRSQAHLDEASSHVGNARKSFEDARGQIQRDLRAAVDLEIQTLQSTGSDGFAAAVARAQGIAGAFAKTPPDDGTARQFETLARGLTRARRSFDLAITTRDLPEVRRAAGVPGRLLRQLDEIAATLGLDRPVLPEPLRRGAEAFFEGDYAAAIAALPDDVVTTIGMPFTTHAYAVRAASAFARYHYSGGTDAAQLEQAGRDVAACRALDPSFRPTPTTYSPRFITFFISGAAAIQ